VEEVGSIEVVGGTVVSIGSSGSVITGSTGSLVVVESAGTVVSGTLEVVVSIGSSGSVIVGPTGSTVVTDPEVDASVEDGAEDAVPGSPGIVVDGKLAEPVAAVLPTTQVGWTPGELGISNSGIADSSVPWISSSISVLSTLTASPRVASVSRVTVDSGSVDTVETTEVTAGGADSWGSLSEATVAGSVDEEVLDGGASLVARDETPPTVGPLGLSVPTRITLS
jgi:hypothetical protein